MMNLGYLPGGDMTITTDATTSLIAAKSAMNLLVTGGLLSVLAYTGHPGGLEEAIAIKDWLCGLDKAESIKLDQYPLDLIERAPFLMIAKKQ